MIPRWRHLARPFGFGGLGERESALWLQSHCSLSDFALPVGDTHPLAFVYSLDPFVVQLVEYKNRGRRFDDRQDIRLSRIDDNVGVIFLDHISGPFDRFHFLSLSWRDGPSAMTTLTSYSTKSY